MKYITYILHSVKFKKHYIGYTSNLPSRLLSHKELGKDWTSKYRPWELIFSREFQTKHEAMAYEKWLKSGVGREFINTIPH